MEIPYSEAVRRCYNAGSWLTLQVNEKPSREVCTRFLRGIVLTVTIQQPGRMATPRQTALSCLLSAAVQSPRWMLQPKALAGTTTHPSNDQFSPGHKRCMKRWLQDSLAEEAVGTFTEAGLLLYLAPGGLRRAWESHVFFSSSPCTNYMNQSKEEKD